MIDDQVKDLRRCATLVYLACEASVAAEISVKLTAAANTIERQDAALAVAEGRTLTERQLEALAR